jgi:hypothetical protein
MEAGGNRRFNRGNRAAKVAVRGRSNERLPRLTKDGGRTMTIANYALDGAVRRAR